MKYKNTPFDILNANVKKIKKELWEVKSLASQDIEYLHRSTHNFFMNICLSSCWNGDRRSEEILYKYIDKIYKEMSEKGYTESARAFCNMLGSPMIFYATAIKECADKNKKGGAK